MSNYNYQVGGSLNSDAPTYVFREADDKLYTALCSGEFCHVLNSRQMGKSSLLVRAIYRKVQVWELGGETEIRLIRTLVGQARKPYYIPD